MQLDAVARERVLKSIREAVPANVTQRAEELRRLARERLHVTLAEYLEASGLDLGDVYAGAHGWSSLREAAGLPVLGSGPHESLLRRALGRLLHVDDRERLDTWRSWLRDPRVERLAADDSREARVLRQLVVQLLESVRDAHGSFVDGARLLLEHPQVCGELLELCDVLSTRIAHVTRPLSVLPAVPLHVHARYTRREILAACGVGDGVALRPWREGVYFARALPADLLAFTLDKTEGQFSPTTRYRDYAISRSRIHWESQSVTRAESETGRRYREHVARGSHVWLFARLDTSERAFTFLGPAHYVSHEGELPMGITWQLEHALPGDLFQAFAAAVA
jgi:hypothetical protein